MREEDDHRRESQDTQMFFKLLDFPELCSDYIGIPVGTPSNVPVSETCGLSLIDTRLHHWTDLNLYKSLEICYHAVPQMDARQGVWHSKRIKYSSWHFVEASGSEFEFIFSCLIMPSEFMKKKSFLVVCSHDYEWKVCVRRWNTAPLRLTVM